MSDTEETGKAPGAEGKIQRNLDSMLKQMEVTTEEKKYREENFENVDIMKDYVNNLVCTRCDLKFHNIIKKGEKVRVHPLLGVLMCKTCCDYFGDGDFSVDSEGEDKYCRWCGDGGTIFVCSKCVCGFCDVCIEKHFGENGLEEVKTNDNWTCYFCNPKPLWHLRSLCSLAEEAAKSKMDQLKRRKEGRSLKKERRKKVTSLNVNYDSSADDSNSNSYSDKQIKRRRTARKAERIKRDDSSSSEDGKENHINAKKRELRAKKQPTNEDVRESSDDSMKIKKKKPKISGDETPELEKRKLLVLDKLKSIWKLTQSVMEAGLSSSQSKVKVLSKTGNFNTLESLRKEHEDLKSCINILATSINSAFNSANAITDDFTFDAAINETENIRSQEMKLKGLAKKFQQQSSAETSLDSAGNSSRNELPMKERSGDAVEEGKEKLQQDGGAKSDSSSEGETERGKNVPASESESEKRDAEKDGRERYEERDSGKESGPVKPLLKVKSFARMLNDNVYDNKKEKTPVVIDLYDVETDESESEKQKKESDKPETAASGATEKKKHSSADRNGKSKYSEGKKAKKSKSKSGLEKESDKEDEKQEAKEDESADEVCKAKKRIASEIENANENSKQSEEEKQEDKNETVREATSGDDGGKESSEDEKQKAKEKGKKNSDDNDQDSSEEQERNRRRTRNSNKEKKELKASFEKFKRKRERFLKSTKEAGSDKEVKETKVLESSESGTEEEKKEKKARNCRQKKKRVLASSDDEEDGEKKEEAKSSDEESEKENQNGKSDAEEVKPVTEESSSDEEIDTRKRKRIRKRVRGSSDSGEDSKKKKKKKKKQKKGKGSSSDSSGDEESKKNRKGRKNIKKILKKDSLQVETKEALKNEDERKKRLREKQKLFEELFPQEEGEKTSKRLILDFDPETKEPLVTIHKKLAKHLKPHQISGVKFMWDNCFESVQRLEEESGSGCILAHCMGLGKTLQVVTLVHTVMTHDLGVHSVLIVCPLSTVSNWIREFEMWLENVHTEPIILYDLVKYKKQEERRFHLEDWHKNGGVLVLSYDLFRNLTKTLAKRKRERKTKMRFQTAFERTLLDPGPDLVVCDEGHLLKNEDTALSKCMSRLKTSRRIVLTGTPLQNNLIEYHCMVQFVKPNILGTRKEFCNRFVNPINNGQFEDSTDLDVKIMKRRSHVLHSMLEGCIQRFDYSVLTPFLPEKHEYVLLISLTETQAKVYLHFIQNLSGRSSGSSRAASLFNDYHSLQRIWTHPRTLLMQKEKEDQREALVSDSEGSLKDFIVATDEETSEPGSESSDDSQLMVIEPKKRILRSNANDPEIRKMIEEEEKQQSKNWWDEFYEEKAYDDIRESNKLVLLFDLLKYCGEVKDKVLVFSQSLYSLNLIEYFLAKIDENSKKDDETLCGHQDSWILGTDYFRLDGSTNSETRSIWCKYFNKESNTRARLFLISTRAGGLGINLYGANRVVIFDASWNPSHDLQSIFRVYRFGQKKTCYIYRFLSEATMEEKVYERQVTKLSLAHRVVDEHQIERHYTMGNLQELYTFEPTPREKRKVPHLPKDSVLADLLAKHKDMIVGYHEHDSLLENKEEEELSEEERKAAWREYEEEKVQKTFNFDLAMQQQRMLMLQAQQTQTTFPQMGEVPTRFINPAHLAEVVMNPNFVNTMFVPASVPIDVLQRGMKVGVTPLPNENLDSFLKRILQREGLLQPAVNQ